MDTTFFLSTRIVSPFAMAFSFILSPCLFLFYLSPRCRCVDGGALDVLTFFLCVSFCSLEASLNEYTEKKVVSAFFFLHSMFLPLKQPVCLSYLIVSAFSGFRSMFEMFSSIFLYFSCWLLPLAGFFSLATSTGPSSSIAHRMVDLVSFMAKHFSVCFAFGVEVSRTTIGNLHAFTSENFLSLCLIIAVGFVYTKNIFVALYFASLGFASLFFSIERALVFRTHWMLLSVNGWALCLSHLSQKGNQKGKA